MNYSIFNRRKPTKVIFVWDKTARSIQAAEELANSADSISLHPVYVTPHESLYAYGTVGHSPDEPTLHEKNLRAEFKAAVKSSTHLKHTKLEIVFGDRIMDVIRLANLLKAATVLMPSFRQSSFSKWLHGDLNARAAKVAECEIVLYESMPESVELPDDNRMKKDTQSERDTSQQ